MEGFLNSLHFRSAIHLAGWITALANGQLTIVCNASVFVQQAELRLLLDDDFDVLRPQAGGMAREHEGVAVQAGAVAVHHSAGVVDGVVVVVGGDHPVVVIWEGGERELFDF